MSDVKRTAGISIDGQVATLVIVNKPHTSPQVAVVKQVTNADPAAAISSLLTLVDAQTPLRVAIADQSMQSQPIDITPAMAQDRVTFENLTRRSFPNLHASASLAAVNHNLDAAVQGTLSTGLAFAAPLDNITRLYRATATHSAPSQVTAASSNYKTADGLYLSLRRDTVELTLVKNNQPVLTKLLSQQGSQTLAAKFNYDHQKLTAVMSGAAIDPTASATVLSWFADIAQSVKLTLQTWAQAGYNVQQELYVQGHMATAGLLDEALQNQSLKKSPHPLVAIPFENPLDAADAYYAACSFQLQQPLEVFLNPLPKAKPTQDSYVKSKLPATKTVKLSPKRKQKLFASSIALVALVTISVPLYATWEKYDAEADANLEQKLAQTTEEGKRATNTAQLRQIPTSQEQALVAVYAALDSTPEATQIQIATHSPNALIINVTGPGAGSALAALKSLAEQQGYTYTQAPGGAILSWPQGN